MPERPEHLSVPLISALGQYRELNVLRKKNKKGEEERYFDIDLLGYVKRCFL